MNIMAILNNLHRQNIERLAELAKIPIKFGWIGKLEAHLGVSKGDISRWIKRGVSKDGLSLIEKKGYPASKWMLDEPYEQDPKGQRVKEIIASMTPTELSLIEALRAVDDIDREGLYSLAIYRFHEAKRTKRIAKNEKKKEILDKAIKDLSKAISDS